MSPVRQEIRYDVFISYRRGAADDLALLLQTKLKEHGLAAFLDRDLRRGMYDDKLLEHVAGSATFLVILTPGSLDRCSDEDDWLRKEIVQAIGSGRNIVPLKIYPFQFTTEFIRGMDPAIRELGRYQAVDYSHAYFENTIERIVRIIEEDKAERDSTEERRFASEEPEADVGAREKRETERRPREEKPQSQSLGSKKEEQDQLMDRALKAPAREGVVPTTTKRRDHSHSFGQRKVLLTAGSMMIIAMVAFGIYRFFSGRESKSGLQAQKPLQVPIAAGPVRVDPKDGQPYVWISPGTFEMGCLPGDSGCNIDEQPVHPIEILRGFWMGQTPVTQAAYQKVMGEPPSRFHGDLLPVESVTWNQAKAYCEKVEMRLPTEAEWEYAARAGSVEPRYGEPDAIAWHGGHDGGNSGGRTHDVMHKKQNVWNLYDMLGNVWEWEGDCYDSNYYRNSPSKDPSGPTSGECQYRVLRGARGPLNRGTCEWRSVSSSILGLGTTTLGFDASGNFPCDIFSFPLFRKNCSGGPPQDGYGENQAEK